VNVQNKVRRRKGRLLSALILWHQEAWQSKRLRRCSLQVMGRLDDSILESTLLTWHRRAWKSKKMERCCRQFMGRCLASRWVMWQQHALTSKRLRRCCLQLMGRLDHMVSKKCFLEWRTAWRRCVHAEMGRVSSSRAAAIKQASIYIVSMLFFHLSLSSIQPCHCAEGLIVLHDRNRRHRISCHRGCSLTSTERWMPPCPRKRGPQQGHRRSR
jgi:hypothetical protein